MLVIGSVISTILIQGTLAVVNHCGVGWIYHNEACYFFSNDTDTWVEAFYYCQIYDSQLVSITDQNENNFLKTELRHRHAADSDWNICYFTSGTDAPAEGHWEWTPSRDPFTFTDWRPGEPSNGGGLENCLCLYKAHDFQWNDRNCHNQDHFICKAP
ncbi:perlucin-like [Ylistrum balloti]|uniref:perlucin-like n=1 Tax=Ylistrum balloti TaxID=509963 RepID=UPI0029058845|nr:perlucin-like [Ylistrum balloti]